MENEKIYCGKVNETLLEKEITINGWVRKIRKLGSLIFMEVYDLTGFVQVVVEQNNQYFATLSNLPKESVVEVKGVLKIRKSINANEKTGKFEIILSSCKIYSKSELPPFLIQNDTDGLEDLRLKYRFLDLRRPIMQQNLINRSKIINLFRAFLIAHDFIEIETPYLSKPTPEGARDYLVPTRSKKFFALPQSPQIYKQLLMIAGMNKYFQLARCFRDEDLRADRQPEFTQLDIETSFLSESEIQTMVEKMFAYIFNKFFNINLATPFIKMDYQVAIENYGSDKPDVRFDNKIVNVTQYFQNSNFKIFQKTCEQNNRISAIFIKESVSKNNIKNLEKIATDNKAKGLAYLTIENYQAKDGSIINVMEKEIINKICSDFDYQNGTLFFVADKKEISLQAMGAIRKEFLSFSTSIKLNQKFAFLWIVNWPLFEYSEEENRYVSAHHPFTMPSIKSINDFDTNPKEALAQAYDLVLNGYEIGGGSIRIYDADLQNRMFKFLGLSNEEIDKKFGFFINAFKYGVPPHGGIAFGLERVLMIMLNTNNIRDVIAFPKNSKGIDLLFNAPSSTSDDALEELGIKMVD
ncbi:MAG: aspartate--tRNA ligase [Malacoplasma sp.]|mgnify:CR=1 FL=1|nr:aspartate--tRNA ligase [Malacoplasma sp.]